jgi:hypothetical protein
MGEMRNAYKISVGNPHRRGRRDNFEDSDIDEKIILKRI